MYLNWEFMHVISVAPFKNQEIYYIWACICPLQKSAESRCPCQPLCCFPDNGWLPFITILERCFSCRSKGRVTYSLHSFLCRKCENKSVIKKATGFKKNEKDHISLWKQRVFFLYLNNFTHFCYFSKCRVHWRCQLCSTDSQHLFEGTLGVTLDQPLHLHHIQNGTEFISKQGEI